ncbi:MAG: GNAT family N-acetyltransferase [Solobacterium sp.]|nr:GNAT family N-acetyltransferase [Solobacterium sp.]
MEVCIRRFSELQTDELYRLLRLRVQVFVVEQNCPYQELDNRDQEAVHVWLQEDGKILACLRVMDRGAESEDVSIGRVVSLHRNQGLGMRVLMEGLAVAETVFQADSVYLEAQVQAVPFYEKAGFIPFGEVFIEDGIPHIRMRRQCG